MLERLIGNSKVKTVAEIATLIVVMNIPCAIYTFFQPKEEIKNSLREQINSEMSHLKDISGGAIYTSCGFLGTVMGYTARDIVGK